MRPKKMTLLASKSKAFEFDIHKINKKVLNLMKRRTKIKGSRVYLTTWKPRQLKSQQRSYYLHDANKSYVGCYFLCQLQNKRSSALFERKCLFIYYVTHMKHFPSRLICKSTNLESCLFKFSFLFFSFLQLPSHAQHESKREGILFHPLFLIPTTFFSSCAIKFKLLIKVMTVSWLSTFF